MTESPGKNYRMCRPAASPSVHIFLAFPHTGVQDLILNEWAQNKQVALLLFTDSMYSSLPTCDRDTERTNMMGLHTVRKWGMYSYLMDNPDASVSNETLCASFLSKF